MRDDDRDGYEDPGSAESGSVGEDGSEEVRTADSEIEMADEDDSSRTLELWSDVFEDQTDSSPVLAPWPDGFLERWFGAFWGNPWLGKTQPLRDPMIRYDDHWERDEVIADLYPDHGYHYSTFRVGLELESSFVQHYLSREVSAYSDHLNRVVDTNHALSRASQLLNETVLALNGAVYGLPFLATFEPFLEKLGHLKLEVSEFEGNYWDSIFQVGKFAVNEPDKFKRFKRRGMRALSSSFTLPMLKQERNLDTIFQVRIGDFLRENVAAENTQRYVSILTISRMVILVYICAGLAIDVNGHLIVRDSDPPRELSVSRTYQTLRDAGVR